MDSSNGNLDFEILSSLNAALAKAQIDRTWPCSASEAANAVVYRFCAKTGASFTLKSAPLSQISNAGSGAAASRRNYLKEFVINADLLLSKLELTSFRHYSHDLQSCKLQFAQTLANVRFVKELTAFIYSASYCLCQIFVGVKTDDWCTFASRLSDVELSEAVCCDNAAAFAFDGVAFCGCSHWWGCWWQWCACMWRCWDI
jgi:hypothetical protein